MKELLYTKLGNDYACLMITDEKQIQLDCFGGAEDHLKEPVEMELPFSSQVNDTFAYYFDPETEELKTAKWRYSTEADSRGYVESKYSAVPETALEPLQITSELLDQLRELLLHTFCQTDVPSAKFLKYDLCRLFPEGTDEMLICAFLKLYYLFLPAELAGRVLFITQYSNVRCEMCFALTHASGYTYSFAAFDPSALTLLRNMENLFEYGTLLNAISQDVFGYAIGMAAGNKKQPLRIRIQRILSLWNKIGRKPWRRQNCRKLLLEYLLIALAEEMNCLQTITEFDALLEEYQYILNLFQQPVNEAFYEQYRHMLLFQKFHRMQTHSSYLKEAFRVLSVLGQSILPEDQKHYSELCFAEVCNVTDVRELIGIIGRIAGCSVGTFFRTLALDQEKQPAVKRMYDTLCVRILEELNQYHGYCSDPEFESLNHSLVGMLEIAEVYSYDFRGFLFTNYAIGLKNIMQFENMTSFFLDHTISLETLLQILDGWNCEDVYTKVNLTIFDVLLSALQRDSMDSAEKEQIITCLKCYKAFRMEYDSIVERSTDRQNTDLLLEELEQKHAQLIPELVNAYNQCKDEKAVRILVFLCRNIAGNPAILMFMMYAYHCAYDDRVEQDPFEFYYQFFDLVYLPLIMKGALSFREFQYLIMMCQQSYKPSSKIAKSRSGWQRLRKKAGFIVRSAPAIKESIPAWRSEENPDFVKCLEKRLCRRYQIPSHARTYIADEIRCYHAAYRVLLSQSLLNEYCAAYAELVKQYAVSLISEC